MFQNLFIRASLIALLLFTTEWAMAQNQTGEASYYADKFQGRKTASGELFDQNKLTCAHRKHPFGTMLKVTHLANRRTVTVRVNDRGPFVSGRVIDLSKSAAQRIGLVRDGIAQVRVEVIKKGAGTSQSGKSESNPKAEVSEPVNISSNGPKAGLYQMQAKPLPGKGFGVQIGSFGDYANAVKATSKLNAKGINKTMVHCTRRNGKDLFRIIVGPFESKSKAQSGLQRLKNMGQKGVVVTLSQLK